MRFNKTILLVNLLLVFFQALNDIRKSPLGHL